MRLIPRSGGKWWLLFAVGIFASGVAASDKVVEPAGPDPGRFEAEIRAFEDWDRKNEFPRDAVLFVGSSSIRMWPTAESFPELPIINRGFGGSHAADVNHFIERVVLKYSPRIIVYYAGDNDIADNKSPQRVCEDFETFVNHVQKRLPKTSIVYLPIKPSLARWQKWQQMKEVNSQIKKRTEKNKRVLYVDTATPMLGSDGRPRSELFLDDSLHLNDRGYRLWTDILKPQLARLSAR
jgi:lysophospholipase L1-like esterase